MASTPIDVIRVIDTIFLIISNANKMLIITFLLQTRLMNQKKIIKTQSTACQSSQNQQLYKGSLDCGIRTVRNEGFAALYKGFIPTWFRMGPWNIIFFITYEQLKQLH